MARWRQGRAVPASRTPGTRSGLGFLGRGTQNHEQPGSPQRLTDLHTRLKQWKDILGENKMYQRKEKQEMQPHLQSLCVKMCHCWTACGDSGLASHTWVVPEQDVCVPQSSATATARATTLGCFTHCGDEVIRSNRGAYPEIALHMSPVT